MRALTIIASVAGLACLLACGGIAARRPGTTPKAALGEPVATFTAEALGAKHRENPAAVLDEYAGKTVVVTGKLQGIEEHGSSLASTALAAVLFDAKSHVNIVCYPANKGDLLSLKKGESLKAVGIVSKRFSEVHIWIDSCQFTHLDR